jgi:hypothetical protein
MHWAQSVIAFAENPSIGFGQLLRVNMYRTLVMRILIFSFVLVCAPRLRSKTHAKRKATQHGCLPRLLGDRATGIEKVYGEEKNICIGRTRSVTAEQKFLVPALKLFFSVWAPNLKSELKIGIYFFLSNIYNKIKDTVYCKSCL